MFENINMSCLLNNDEIVIGCRHFYNFKMLILKWRW